MAISKENLGAAVEEIKLSGDESYSSKADLNILSNKVDSISIAQKTVNTKGIKELMTSELTFPMDVSSVEGTAINTVINQTVDLLDSIENYDMINIHITMKGSGRNYYGDIKTLSVPKIYYNSTNIYNNADGSGFFVYYKVHRGNAMAYGSANCGFRCWFKNPNQLYIDIVFNSLKDASFTSLSITSVQGIKLDPITIDPVEYVNTTQGIEDTPVGHVLAFMGKTAPKHYLACDGSIYNIVDYPYLSQYINGQFGRFNFFGGDGITTFGVPDLTLNELKDIIPIMTSNTTPSPIIISASSVYTGGREAFKAFDKSTSTFWQSATPAGWIKVDFSKETFVSGFEVWCFDSSHGTATTMMPKDFTLFGSNDDQSYQEVLRVTGQTNWTNSEKRKYLLNSDVKFRFYRIEVLTNNGHVVTDIANINFYSKNNDKPKSYIKYEPTYFMNIQGLIEENTLWEGNVGTTSTTLTSTINLSDSIVNYDKIRIHYYAATTTNAVWYLNKEITIYDFNSVKNNPLNTCICLPFGLYDSKSYTNILKSSTTTKLNLEQYESYVTKIVGIKYKTF